VCVTGFKLLWRQTKSPAKGLFYCQNASESNSKIDSARNCYTICITISSTPMNAITSREVIHHFSAVAARVAAGEELTVTRYGIPVLKLVQVSQTELSQPERQALMQKLLAIRMTGSLGKKFERSDAYDE
jgi:antitoxin (DNA-binding transcriptional repressor) of toxin-antitoxin stability system